MQIGEVVGTVVSTVKDRKLKDLKLQVVRIKNADGSAAAAYVVAVDAVGAGHGDHVLLASGSSARQTELTQGLPADCVIMAVIDSWDVGGQVIYDAEGPA